MEMRAGTAGSRACFCSCIEPPSIATGSDSTSSTSNWRSESIRSMLSGSPAEEVWLEEKDDGSWGNAGCCTVRAAHAKTEGGVSLEDKSSGNGGA